MRIELIFVSLIAAVVIGGNVVVAVDALTEAENVVAVDALTEAENVDDVAENVDDGLAGLEVEAEEVVHDDDNDDADNIINANIPIAVGQRQPQPQQQQRRSRRRWTDVDPSQREFVKEVRSRVGDIKIDTRSRLSLFNRGWKFAPIDPDFEELTCIIKPGKWCVHPVGAWVPHRMWKEVVSYPCAFCEDHCSVPVSSAQWPGAPRRVIGEEQCWYLDTITLRCDKCRRRFRATHPACVAHMGNRVRAKFDVFMGARFAVDRTLASRVSMHWGGEGSATLAKKISLEHRGCYIAAMVRYFARGADQRAEIGALRPQPTGIARFTQRADSAAKAAMMHADASRRSHDRIQRQAQRRIPHRRTDLGKISGLGTAKILRLRANGITYAEHLADWADLSAKTLKQMVPNKKEGVEGETARLKTFKSWQTSAQKYFEKNAYVPAQAPSPVPEPAIPSPAPAPAAPPPVHPPADEPALESVTIAPFPSFAAYTVAIQ